MRDPGKWKRQAKKMNRNVAKKIAEVITSEQFQQMFERAKSSITNWNVRSNINPLMSKGKSWNIYYPLQYDERIIPKTNAIREFGEYLPKELQDRFKPRKRELPESFYHEEPKF